MNAERTDLERIFNEAAEIEDPAARTAFLDEACAGNARLRAEILELLEHDARADSFLEHPPVEALLEGQAAEAASEHATLAPRANGAAAETAPGSRIRYMGDYELLEEIGRGGMGVVYKARQVSLNRMVAVKMIVAGQLASEAEIQRFHTEARAAAQLQHPNIVSVHEVGEHDGQQYFSMDYVEGPSLADVLRRGPWPARAAAVLVKTLAEAVHVAHEHGILHRDLKPSNVLLQKDEGARVKAEGQSSGNSGSSFIPQPSAFQHPAAFQPLITDFGLAKQITKEATQAATAQPQLTATGQALGTPGYMAPEQAAGAKRGKLGPPTDVYSLGVILYELLTGRPPFQAATPVETILQALDQDPVAPRQLNRGIPRDLETICLKCLEKESQRRYATAQELADDLGRYSRDEPIRARRAGAAVRLAKWCRRHPVSAVLGVVLTWQAANSVVLSIAIVFGLDASWAVGFSYAASFLGVAYGLPIGSSVGALAAFSAGPRGGRARAARKGAFVGSCWGILGALVTASSVTAVCVAFSSARNWNREVSEVALRAGMLMGVLTAIVAGMAGGLAAAKTMRGEDANALANGRTGGSRRFARGTIQRRARTARWSAVWFALLLVIGLGLVLTPCDDVVVGLLGGERFYQGRPATYWATQLRRSCRWNLWDEANCALLRPDRQQCIGALKRTGPDGIAALIPLLKENNWNIGDLALSVLKSVAPDRQDAIPLLVQAIEDPKLDLRWTVRRETKGRTVMERIERSTNDPDFAIRVANALGAFGATAEPAIPALIKLVKNGDTFTCQAAVAALVNVGPAAVPHLVRTLQGHDLDTARRVTLIQMLGTMGPDARAAVPFLLKQIELQRDSDSCLEALRTIDPRRPVR